MEMGLEMESLDDGILLWDGIVRGWIDDGVCVVVGVEL